MKLDEEKNYISGKIRGEQITEHLYSHFTKSEEKSKERGIFGLSFHFSIATIVTKIFCQFCNVSGRFL